MSDQNSYALECQELHFSYNNTPILENVSFNVKEGEFIGIIGPNGGGKTTLLRLIMGFLKPTSGWLKIPTKGGISYVPQITRFDRQFPISVLDVVLGGLLNKLPWYGRFSKEDRDAAKQALEQVGLIEFAHEPLGNLSGGQTQRVLIARALVSKPHLLLLDEPTASIDSRSEAQLYSLFETLKGEMTILMVTHDLQIAVEKVDRILCVQHEVSSLLPQEVCSHFAMGLYHPPLKQFQSR